EADFEKTTWLQKGIISLVAVPLVLNDVLLGFFGVVSQYSERQWSSGEVKLLELLGSIFVNALVHRQSIEQLRASEAHNRALLAAIPDLVFVLTQEGVFLNCTQKEGLTLLLPPEQFIGRHMAEVLPPDVAQIAQENIDRALETGAVQCYEYELLLPGDVTPRIYEARLSLSSEGQVLVVSRDVTDYKDAVAALQWRNHELSFLNRVVLIGASSTDVIEVLQVLCDELAFTFELPQVGAAFVDIETGTFEIVAEYHIPSRLPIIGNREQVQDVGEFMRLFDTQQPLHITGQALDKLGELGCAVHQQGTESVLFVPLVVRNKVISVLGMDITPMQTLDDPADLMLIQSAAMAAAQALEAVELNQTLQRRAKNLESLVEQRTKELQVALAQAKAADLAKTRFLRSVSHELRTPLTDMKLYLDLLERGRGDRRQSYFEALRHITDDFQALIEELLEISRFDLGNVQIHLWPTDINQLVKLVVDAYRKQFVEHNLCLEVLPAQRLPLMSVDTKLMQRAINNLLKNALIYTPSGGDISVYTDIGTRDEQEWVIISIKDTGVGISEEDYPLLFTPFFRGKAYENHNVPGAGLGLPITKQILELHDGNLTVESELGKGSVFTIWLPMTLSVGDP
ncbi:MAG: PAS domain-containing protein, partial [Anaerolineae bacterium]|nr:PAS domain-containing protein [Anaerolineae bacterium]